MIKNQQAYLHMLPHSSHHQQNSGQFKKRDILFFPPPKTEKGNSSLFIYSPILYTTNTATANPPKTGSLLLSPILILKETSRTSKNVRVSSAVFHLLILCFSFKFYFMLFPLLPAPMQGGCPDKKHPACPDIRVSTACFFRSNG